MTLPHHASLLNTTAAAVADLARATGGGQGAGHAGQSLFVADPSYTLLMPWQVLIRRELEEAAKVLGERVRTGEATSEVRRVIRSLACLLQVPASLVLCQPIRHQ